METSRPKKDYHIFRIPKRKGEWRVIYAPTRRKKRELRVLLTQVSHKVDRLPNRHLIHGFRRRCSPVSNAMAHVGHAWTITMDIQDFFPNVTPEKLKGKLSQELIDAVIVDGHAPQGFPTSPAVANMAASTLDESILKWISKTEKQVVYTRYADDLTFSGDDPTHVPPLLEEIPRIARRCGWTVHPRKTHVYWAKGGRRIVTGVAVDDDGVHPTREVRRRLRAARHQAGLGVPEAMGSLAGLEEWCRLKPPHQRSSSKIAGDLDLQDQIRKVAAHWRLGRVFPDQIPDKGDDVDLGEGCVLTGDPVLMLGMSTFTTGWTSCMRQPTGQYRRGVVFWMHIRGTRIAAFLSDKTLNIDGVERPKMRARCLVHKLRESGALVYDRVYGGNEAAEHLVRQLRAKGIIPVTEARTLHPGAKVEGHAPSRWRAYFDNLSSTTAKSTSGEWRGREVRVPHL